MRSGEEGGGGEDLTGLVCKHWGVLLKFHWKWFHITVNGYKVKWNDFPMELQAGRNGTSIQLVVAMGYGVELCVLSASVSSVW